MRFDVQFNQTDQRFAVVFNDGSNLFDTVFKEVQQVTVTNMEFYDGEYEITPQRQEQVLATSGKALRENIIVGAIPQQYGLITYDQDRRISIT